MGYRITYGQNTIITKLPANRRKTMYRSLLCVLLVAVALAGAVCIKSVRHFLLPGDPVVTEKALKDLVTDLRSGEKVSDAVTAFCEVILDNA